MSRGRAPERRPARRTRARHPRAAQRDAPRHGSDLDASAIESLRELDGEGFLTEVIDTFLDDATALVAALRATHDAGDAEELRRTAHILKSNGQVFGARGFSALCRELEERARDGELEGTATLIDRIEVEYGALEEALAALRPAFTP